MKCPCCGALALVASQHPGPRLVLVTWLHGKRTCARALPPSRVAQLEREGRA